MIDHFPRWAWDSLRCPVSGAALEQVGDELVAVQGSSPRLAYPIRNGIPVLLEHEARCLQENDAASSHAPAGNES